MTLKSKFLKLYHKFAISDEWEGSLEDDAVKIADDYAIEFAEWKDKFIDEVADWKQDGVYLKNRYTTKELLEIYKKEKGL